MRIFALILLFTITATAEVALVRDGSVVATWQTLPTRSPFPEYRNSNPWHAGLRPNEALLDVVPFTVPDGYVTTGARTLTVDGDEVRESYSVVTAQAAQAAQLQAVVDAAGSEIRALEAIVDYFGIERPVTKAHAIAHIEEWQTAKAAAGDVAAMVAGNTKSLKLLALFDGLAKAGLDESTINSVWAYMVATGQAGE